MKHIFPEASAASAPAVPPMSLGDNGAKLQNGVEVETCGDRHAGPACKTAADWLKKHPHAKHPVR